MHNLFVYDVQTLNVNFSTIKSILQKQKSCSKDLCGCKDELLFNNFITEELKNRSHPFTEIFLMKLW
uniref:Uncharacterized protein n=1 Tax=Octopus bimaculoides TaxID=37653 RepID=A0A0L8HZ50_OCTBM